MMRGFGEREKYGNIIMGRRAHNVHPYGFYEIINNSE